MLYLISTPIGNLEDISPRAVRALSEADYLLVEDSRVTGNLLKNLEIDQRMVPFHAHNEHKKLDSILGDLQASKNIGLVSDAGTPGISDPGFLLVRACRQSNLQVTAIPGPTAVITALSISGIPCDRYFFEGFLPHKKGRKKRLEFLSQLPETFVLFESPYRVKKCLKELKDHCGPTRLAAICRELTKLHEEVLYGELSELAAIYEDQKAPRGEFVLVVEGNKA
ncbi:MAG: 16S rRNA (cytidine(1402)-2'-O)-methyltransferase [Saprospirales bacterium]|nr:MAG: 16S rRNA (cytidine(1402)-2'-O)-methyltransferase [Saprospirales bacterium]